MWHLRIAYCIVAVSGLLAAGPSGAQSVKDGVFIPPEGCTGWLTVQSRSCRVSNHYKCDADPPGDQWRADFKDDGLVFLSRIDRETQWVESIEMDPPVRQTLQPDPPDPASFSNLLETGRDTYDFALSRDDGTDSTVRGFDRLTGVSVTIDSVVLEETEFAFTEMTEDGTVLNEGSGREFIHRDWRIFLSGVSNWETEEGTVTSDGTPRKFIFPGEPGFFSTTPIFDCNAIMSDAEPDGLMRVSQ